MAYDGESFAYKDTWSQNLDRIAGDSPDLADFRFDHGGSYVSDYEEGHVYGFKHR
jgi:hypothetical protein